MMSKYLTTIFFFFFLSQNVFADVPPCWCKFSVKSKNSKFIATVDRLPEDSLKEPWQARWTLTITKIAEAKEVVWKTQYDYSGYPDGQLSDDGNYFVYIEYWFYKDVSLVKIYKTGSEIDTKLLTGDSFKISKNKLINSVSHELWLSDFRLSGFQILKDQLVYKITTIDKKQHFINLNTGSFIKL